jgi:hypothetical protein
MPTKGPGELTGDEVKLLVIASKLLAALHAYSERPPPQRVQGYWTDMVHKELVRPNNL